MGGGNPEPPAPSAAEDLSPSTTGEAAGKTDSPAPAAKKRGRPRATASKVKMSRRRVDEAPATLEPDTAAGPGPALEAQAASPVRVQPDGGREGPQRGTAPTLDEYAEQGEQGERGGRGPSRLLSPAADPVRPASIALSGAANPPEWTAAGSLEDAGASPSSLPPPETAAAPAVPPAVHHQDESLGSAGASVSAMGDPAAAIGDDSVRGGGAWGEERVPGPTTSTPDAEARSPAAPALPADAPAGRGSGSASPSEAPSPLLPGSTAPEPPSPIRHWEGPPSAVEASPASDPTRDEEPTGRPSVEVALPVAEGQGGPILGTPGEEGPTHAAQTEHDTEDSPASGPAAPDPADAPGGASPSPPAPSPPSPSPSPSPSPAAPAPPAPRSMAGNLVSAVRSLLPGSRPPAPALSSARPAARLAALEKADAARRAQEARDAERERRRLELERARAERLAAKQAADAEEARERAEAALRKQQEAAARRKQQLEAGKGGAGPKRKEVALAFGAALPPATADAVPRHASQAAAQQARPALHKPDRVRGDCRGVGDCLRWVLLAVGRWDRVRGPCPAWVGRPFPRASQRPISSPAHTYPLNCAGERGPQSQHGGATRRSTDCRRRGGAWRRETPEEDPVQRAAGTQRGGPRQAEAGPSRTASGCAAAWCGADGRGQPSVAGSGPCSFQTSAPGMAEGRV